MMKIGILLDRELLIYITKKCTDIRNHLDYIRQGYIQTQVSKCILPNTLFRNLIAFEPTDCNFMMLPGWIDPFLNPSIESGEIESLTGIQIIDFDNASIFCVLRDGMSQVNSSRDSFEKVLCFQEFVIRVVCHRAADIDPADSSTQLTPLSANATSFENWFKASMSDAEAEAESNGGYGNAYEEIARALMQCVEIYIETFNSDESYAASPQLYSQFSLVVLATVAMADALFTADPTLATLAQEFSPGVMHNKKLLERLQGFVYPRKDFIDLADSVTKHFLVSACTRTGLLSPTDDGGSEKSDDEKARDAIRFASQYASSRPPEHMYHTLLKRYRATIAENMKVPHFRYTVSK